MTSSNVRRALPLASMAGRWLWAGKGKSDGSWCLGRGRTGLRCGHGELAGAF